MGFHCTGYCRSSVGHEANGYQHKRKSTSWSFFHSVIHLFNYLFIFRTLGSLNTMMKMSTYRLYCINANEVELESLNPWFLVSMSILASRGGALPATCLSFDTTPSPRQVDGLRVKGTRSNDSDCSKPRRNDGRLSRWIGLFSVF